MSDTTIEPQYLIQALSALLQEAQQQIVVLTALVNQQAEQLRQEEKIDAPTDN